MKDPDGPPVADRDSSATPQNDKGFLVSIYSQIDSNKRRTWIIILLFITLIAGVGYILGEASGYGPSWFGLALVLAGASSFFSYYYSDKVVLAISGAKQIAEEDNPRLFHAVENLCIGAGIQMPKIYLIDDTAPNAFATGRDPKHAAIAVTTGLLDKLDKLELEGVIAHELSHVKNYDIRLMSVIVILVGVVALVSDWFLRSMWLGGRRRDQKQSGGGLIFLLAMAAAILAPIVAQLLKFALGRRREFLADASGALLTRYPNGLANALEKIAADREPLEVANSATAHLYIVNPLKNYSDKVSRLFSTHPQIEERVAALRAM